MKARAEQALTDFKEAYQSAYNDSRHSQGDEALALGVDTSTSHNWLRVDVERHLPAALVPGSLFATELMQYLATQCGGVYVPLHGDLHEDANKALSAVLRAAGEIVKAQDPKERQRLFKVIEQNAAKASTNEATFSTTVENSTSAGKRK